MISVECNRNKEKGEYLYAAKINIKPSNDIKANIKP